MKYVLIKHAEKIRARRILIFNNASMAADRANRGDTILKAIDNISSMKSQQIIDYIDEMMRKNRGITI